MKKNGYFNVLAAFKCVFGWNKVIYASTHVCFILLTLVGSLNTRLIGLVLKKIHSGPDKC